MLERDLRENWDSRLCATVFAEVLRDQNYIFLRTELEGKPAAIIIERSTASNYIQLSTAPKTVGDQSRYIRFTIDSMHELLNVETRGDVGNITSTRVLEMARTATPDLTAPYMEIMRRVHFGAPMNVAVARELLPDVYPMSENAAYQFETLLSGMKIRIGSKTLEIERKSSDVIVVISQMPMDQSTLVLIAAEDPGPKVIQLDLSAFQVELKSVDQTEMQFSSQIDKGLLIIRDVTPNVDYQIVVKRVR